MPSMSTLSVGAAVTPTVLITSFYHYLYRKRNKGKPTSHISYHEGLVLVRKFLEYASHRTVEELQAFTAQRVPVPYYVHVENVTIEGQFLDSAAKHLVNELGPSGCHAVGGKHWWRWRLNDLKCECIEMRKDYHSRIKHPERTDRIMLYVHGGGYYFGSVDEHRYQIQRHARKLKARALAPRYRLAPQFPFPCAIQDVLASYLFLISKHHPSTIILAGDSAGAGMIVSILVILRSQGVPMPAGSILISPWVDLNHSFASVIGDPSGDYIPSHGFQHRHSPAWPPPSDEDFRRWNRMEEGEMPSNQSKLLPVTSPQDGKGMAPSASNMQTAVKEHNGHLEVVNGDGKENEPEKLKERNRRPSVMIDDVEVVIMDQIQMYTTNDLLSHPLVSPVLQASLGGLPPMLVITGGGELLRDEQIYLAHKAANPKRYPTSPAILSNDPRQVGAASKWRHGTDVMLQVYDDCCHVGTTLSFSKPGKYMYRAVARFGDWLLAKSAVPMPVKQPETGENRLRLMSATGQGEIVRADTDSVISFSSTSSSSSSCSSDDGNSTRRRPSTGETNENPPNLRERVGAHVGRVESLKGSTTETLTFQNHMIRQRVDRHGNIFVMEPPGEIECLNVPCEDIGIIKPGPVKRWMEARKKWDVKFEKHKKKVYVQRESDSDKNGCYAEFVVEGTDIREIPPPSALAGSRRKKEMIQVPHRSNRTSFGLKFWSMMGAQQDVKTLKMAEKAENAATKKETKEKKKSNKDGATADSTDDEEVAGVEIPTSPKHVKLPGSTPEKTTGDDLEFKPLGVLPSHEEGDSVVAETTTKTQ